MWQRLGEGTGLYSVYWQQFEGIHRFSDLYFDIFHAISCILDLCFVRWMYPDAPLAQSRAARRRPPRYSTLFVKRYQNIHKEDLE